MVRVVGARQPGKLAVPNHRFGDRRVVGLVENGLLGVDASQGRYEEADQVAMGNYEYLLVLGMRGERLSREFPYLGTAPAPLLLHTPPTSRTESVTVIGVC